MQRHEPLRPDPGVGSRELWASRFVLLLCQLAVVIALGWFVFVAVQMRGRMSLPAWTIPAATVFSVGLCAYLLIRSAVLARTLFRRTRGG